MADNEQELIDNRNTAQDSAGRVKQLQVQYVDSYLTVDTESIALFIEEDSLHGDEIVQTRIERYIIIKFSGQPKKRKYDTIISNQNVVKHLIMKKPSGSVWDRRNMSDLLNTNIDDHEAHIYLGKFTDAHVIDRTDTTPPRYTVTIPYTSPIPKLNCVDEESRRMELYLKDNPKVKFLIAHGLKPIEFKGNVLKQFAVPCKTIITENIS